MVVKDIEAKLLEIEIDKWKQSLLRDTALRGKCSYKLRT